MPELSVNIVCKCKANINIITVYKNKKIKNKKKNYQKIEWLTEENRGLKSELKKTMDKLKGAIKPSHSSQESEVLLKI